jgi:DNA repair protein RAD7
LTDFLASHNISADQIHQDYLARQQQAQQQAAQDAAAGAAAQNADDDDDGEDPVEVKKRKRKEEKMMQKIKQSKEFKRRKFEAQRDGDSDSDDAIARRLMATNKPLAGQLENCELCEKRFTVTPYSKTGPDGGLLCVKCSKELKDEEKKAQNAARKEKAAPSKGRRRQTESDRMMGDVKPGAKTLLDMCVRKVADVVNDIEEFGDMPQNVVDRLSQILSKRRVMNGRTVDLFIRDNIETFDIYDSANLEEEDFHRIFSKMPQLTKINLRWAGQLKDDALANMAAKSTNLQYLQINAANLLSEQAWLSFFEHRGSQLFSLKLSELGEGFNDTVVEAIAKHCPNLHRLKLEGCPFLTQLSLKHISTLTNLQHLTLGIAQTDTAADTLESLISLRGSMLVTLCLDNYAEVNDDVLDAIRYHCNILEKLRITGSSTATDRAFASLFNEHWKNPPIAQISLHSNRDIDNMNPDGPEDDPVGLCDAGFAAMMAHSGQALEKLDIHSCRHITVSTLMDVFDGKQRYPHLKSIDVSFINSVDDTIMAGIFKSCPALKKLVVFGCFNARSARIRDGVAVIGLPNAGEKIVVGEFEGGVLDMEL